MEIDLIFEWDVDFVSTIELERSTVNAYIFDNIECKFSYWQMFGPVILLLIDKNWKIYLNRIIPSLSLAICLRMRDDGELLLDIEKVK